MIREYPGELLIQPYRLSQISDRIHIELPAGQLHVAGNPVRGAEPTHDRHGHEDGRCRQLLPEPAGDRPAADRWGLRQDQRPVHQGGRVARNGAPHPSKLASVFCIPKTNNAAIDPAANLPGPGAFSITGNAQGLP